MSTRRTSSSCTADRRCMSGAQHPPRSRTSPVAGSACSTSTTGGRRGYGRAYRERLRGQWGVVDVDDVIAAARGLAESGRADAGASGHRRRFGRRMDGAVRARRIRRVRGRDQPVRRRGSAPARRGHARLRVPLPRQHGRSAPRGGGALRREVAAVASRTIHDADADRAGTRRHGRAAIAVRGRARRARRERGSARLSRVRGRGPRIPARRDRRADAGGGARLPREGVRVRDARPSRARV